jgi:CBS domain-containing protein
MLNNVNENQAKRVKEVMTSHPVLIEPDATLKEAAQTMQDLGCGVLPVGSERAVEGVITDRDIVIRAVAEGKDPAEEVVRDYMTREVYECNEDDTLKEAADRMRKHQVSRLIVQDDAGNLSGIISFGSMLRKDNREKEVTDIVEHAYGKAKAG